MPIWKKWNTGTVCALLASVACAEPSAPPAANAPLPPCVATDSFTPICGLHAPEDLYTLDDLRLLVVQMRGMTGTADSNLAVLNLASGDVRVLPVRPAAAAPDWGDGACKEPDPRPGFHGINSWTAADGKVRLLVVNHGTRSSIERYRLDQDGSGESLAWEGCVEVPADIELNDLAALPGGAFVATVMGEARHFVKNEGLEFLLSGNDTGGLVVWSAAKGWETLPGSRAPFPNGIVASPDGRFLYYSAWTGRRVLKYDRAAKAIVARAELDYLPDNLSWSPEGTILTAGILDVASVRKCINSGTPVCSDGYRVSEIDPQTMVAHTLASGPPGVLGGASVAVRIGDALYVGAFSGDRILKIPTDAK
jgi:hypothetical protein